MKIVIGNVWQRTVEGDSVTITNTMSDPVPTCQIMLRDNTSALTIGALQEVLILDDTVIPNPTINYFLDPSLSNIAANWDPGSATGMTVSQVSPGGIKATLSNLASNALVGLQFLLATKTLNPTVFPGITYTFSVYVQGSSPVNFGAGLDIQWNNGSGGAIRTDTFTGPATVSTTLTRYSLTATAPAGTNSATCDFFVAPTNATNSGSVTFTQAMLEPQWFSTLSYPTPYCGPNQTNCNQFGTNSLWYRQYRKFAGFVNHVVTKDYHGNARTLQIDASGYAWLMSLVLANNSYTSQADSAIISNLLTTYYSETSGFGGIGTVQTFTTTNVVQGAQISSLQANWDDLRSLFDTLSSQSGFYWTVDAYWNVIYAPPGYNTMPISLICDNSSVPDTVTTFPAYNFSTELDYTQPGSSILVIGSGSNVAQVIDPSIITTNISTMTWVNSGGSSNGNLFMRKINDSALQSVTDCTNRGMAELLQYDKPRNLYHLTTNVELIAGQGIAVTSNTDSLNKTVLLIQQVTAHWIGTNETLTDVWEYQADLGATNRHVAHILSRLFRLANQNTSAPAISTITLAALENIAFTDTAATATSATGYQATIQADTPIAYYRLDELSSTTVDDFSGNAYQGTTHGGVTQNIAGLLTDPADTSDTATSFNGTSGYISLPTTFVPTGAHAWSLECWCRVSALPTNQWNAMVGFGNRASLQMAVLFMNNTSSVYTFQVGMFGSMLVGSAFVANTTYHVVGTYDGTNVRLYVNGSLVAGPTAFALNLTANFANIGADGSSAVEFFPGTLDECAFYNYALSATQISNHYTAGT